LINSTIENEGYITNVGVTSYEIKGIGEPNSAIQIKIIDRNKIFLLKETNVNSDGIYSLHFDVSSLADGYLTIEVAPSSDLANSTTKKIIKDTSGPDAEIHTNDNVTQSSMSSYRIEGKTEPFSEVTISVKDLNNGSVVTNIEADLSGMFTSTLNLTPLIEGELTIEVFSKDKLGNKGNLTEQKITKTTSTYVLTLTEQQRWNISNNGTSPIETTNGFNGALIWANQNNYSTFVVPAGTYLIRKGDPNDPIARINMVSNMNFLLEKGAILQKETNGKEHYDLLYVGAGIQNVTLQGGIYRGDKDTHDYSQKDNPYTAGTHESGYGIRIEGAINIIIENVLSEKFTGDGLVIGGTGQLISEFYKESFEIGGVNDSGTLINDNKKIRIFHKTKANFNKPIFNSLRTIQLSNPKYLSKNIPYSLYFYKEDGSFISSSKNKKIGWDLIEVPDNSYYFIAVLDTPTIPSGIYIEYWVKTVSKDIIVKESEFAFNRRQGITVGGADNILIENNKIHDIKGTAPQSGIDLEGGVGENGYVNNNVYIKNNQFYNNQAYDLILFDGKNAFVEGNYFGSTGAIGLSISPPFSTAIIKENTFEGTRIIAYHDAVFLDNKMSDSYTFFEGPNILIDGMEFVDSRLLINSKVPFGIEVKNVVMQNNKKGDTGLSLWGKPIHLKDVSIYGESTLRSIVGGVEPGSIFDNLKVIGFNSAYGLDLPPGIYNQSIFEMANGGRLGAIFINKGGKYEFNECTFITNSDGATAVIISNINSEVEFNKSLFEILGDATAVSVQATKNIVVEHCTITALNVINISKELIKINDYWQRNNPYDVLAAKISRNIITSNIAAKGISTIYAGVGAPPYFIIDNILFNAKLQLKDNDIIENNQELSK
jgi:Right handed beta helix region/Bacterial Ig-like domain